MSWKNLKTFLIVMLAMADLFLAVMLIRQSNASVYSSESISQIQELLSESGIYADKALLLQKSYELRLCKTQISENIPAVASSVLLSGQIEETFLLPDGCAFYTDAGEKLTVTADSRFVYSDGTEIDAEESGVPIDSKKELKAIEKNLTARLGLDTSSEDNFGISILSAEETSAGTLVRAVQTIGGTEIVNNTVICVLSGEKLVFADGSLCFLTISERISAHLLDSVNILFIEKGENVGKEDILLDENDTSGASLALAEENTGKENRTVLKMLQCYVSRYISDEDLFYFLPCWQITFDGGETIYYNAVNGEKTIP